MRKRESERAKDQIFLAQHVKLVGVQDCTTLFIEVKIRDGRRLKM